MLGSYILIGAAFLLSLIAQGLVKSTFAKYAKVGNSRKINGAQTAKLLMQVNGINNVKLEPVRGSLSDHYDPVKKILRLSEPVFGVPSISAVSVAAHEVGHALQDKHSYKALRVRNSIVPLANIGSTAGPYLAIAGLIAHISILTQIGIFLFAGAVLFYLITLPVEFNASARALKELERNNVLVNKQELKAAKKVLTAAALTYVASALTAVANLFHLFLLAKRRD